MQVSVTFRRIDASDTLRNYAQEKLYRIKKFVDDPIEAHVVLSVEKFRHIAEVSINANGLRINGQEETGDMYSAIDMVVDKLERQVKRHRQKLKGRKTGKRKTKDQIVEDIGEMPDDEAEDVARVIRTRQTFAKPMDVEEAAMQLDLSSDSFLVFTNSSTEQINVLCRLDDGNYELIEPQSD